MKFDFVSGIVSEAEISSESVGSSEDDSVKESEVESDVDSEFESDSDKLEDDVEVSERV